MWTFICIQFNLIQKGFEYFFCLYTIVLYSSIRIVQKRPSNYYDLIGMNEYYKILFFVRKSRLTTAEIAELFADGVDDSDLDPDYEDGNKDASSTDSGSDSDTEGEVRVYIDPPKERAEADTDNDSGKGFFLNGQRKIIM